MTPKFFVTRIPSWYGVWATTLPPFGILITPEHKNDAVTIRHELEHWEQYRRMGFWKFYGLYLWYSLKYGYRNNPMEVEARAASIK